MALIHRQIAASLSVALVVVHVGQVAAQDAAPAPLLGQAAPLAKSMPFPSGGAAPLFGVGSGAPLTAPNPSESCVKDFVPLREEAEKRLRLIKAASDRKALPNEACKLIGSYGQAEIRMIRYIEANAARCGFAPGVADQLKAGHKKTEALQKKACAFAERVVPDRSNAEPRALDGLGRPLVGDFGHLINQQLPGKSNSGIR